MDDAGDEEHGDDWDGMVSEALTYLEGSYGQGKLREADRDLIDYSADSTQAAYVFMYVAAHAEFIYQVLRAFRETIGTPLFVSKDIDIASLGCGPGSEILGLVKYLEEYEPDVQRISYAAFDKEGSWNHVADLVVGSIESEIGIDIEYFELDVCEDCSQVSLAGNDLIFMSFFISEISATQDGAAISAGLKHLLGSVSAGSYLLYNDSKAITFLNFLKSRISAAKKYDDIAEVDESLSFTAPDIHGIYQDYIDKYERTPKLNSKAVSKLYKRSN